VPRTIKLRGEYKWLSNFGEGDASYDGVTYHTAEHAYQAAKTLDPDERQQILNAPSPRKAKQLGMKVTLRPGWDHMRVSVMRQVLYSKFANPELKQQLLDTGDATLTEGADWGDNFWGKVDDQGADWLGRLLMEIRATYTLLNP